MTPYLGNKMFSLGITLTLMIMVVYSGMIPNSWYILFLLFTVLGYGHYITSLYYQLRGPVTTGNTRYLLWFCLFGILSIGIALVGLWYGLVPYLSLCAIIIFTLHGAFNEPLHDRILGGYSLSGTLWIGFAFLLSGLVILSSHSQSFFFSPYGVFNIIEPTGLSLRLYEIIHPHLWLGAIGLCFALGSYLVIKISSLPISLRVGIFVITILAYAHGLVWGQEYIYWLFGLLVYHFITWLVFSYQHYKGAQRRTLNYITLGSHGLIIMLFVHYLVSPEGATEYIFSSYVFLTATYFHIITSIINEPWCKQLLKL